MLNKFRALVAVAICYIFAVPIYASPILQVDSSGVLMGATGVVVNGASYDVLFTDGSCASLFSGCNNNEDFTFHSLADSASASEALLAQVIIGFFDTHSATSYIAGCPDLMGCSIFTPYEAFTSPYYPGQLYNLTYAPYNHLNPHVTSAYSFWYAQLSTADRRDNTFAIWHKTSYVPEPSSITLLGLAGLVFFWSRRRFNNQQT